MEPIGPLLLGPPTIQSGPSSPPRVLPRLLAEILGCVLGDDLRDLLRSVDAALPGFSLDDLQAFLQSRGFSCAHVQTRVTTAMVCQDITAAVIATPQLTARRFPVSLQVPAQDPAYALLARSRALGVAPAAQPSELPAAPEPLPPPSQGGDEHMPGVDLFAVTEEVTGRASGSVPRDAAPSSLLPAVRPPRPPPSVPPIHLPAPSPRQRTPAPPVLQDVEQHEPEDAQICYIIGSTDSLALGEKIEGSFMAAPPEYAEEELLIIEHNRVVDFDHVDPVRLPLGALAVYPTLGPEEQGALVHYQLANRGRSTFLRMLQETIMDAAASRPLCPDTGCHCRGAPLAEATGQPYLGPCELCSVVGTLYPDNPPRRCCVCCSGDQWTTRPRCLSLQSLPHQSLHKETSLVGRVGRRGRWASH